MGVPWNWPQWPCRFQPFVARLAGGGVVFASGSPVPKRMIACEETESRKRLIAFTAAQLKSRAVDHALDERGKTILVFRHAFDDSIERGAVVILHAAPQRKSEHLGGQTLQKLITFLIGQNFLQFTGISEVLAAQQ